MVTDRSACGVSVLVSVVTKVGPPGGVTSAALTSEPVAVGSIVAVKLKVTVAPTGRPTGGGRGPPPAAGGGGPPPPPQPPAPPGAGGGAAAPGGGGREA